MHAAKISWKEHLRIAFSIGMKDIVDGMRNKNTIALLLSALFVVVSYRFLPNLYADRTPRIRVYDAGESMLVRELENSVELYIASYETEAQMKDVLRDRSEPELGLIIPPDFDTLLASGDPPVLQGYVLHWVKAADARELQRFLEEHLLDILGTPIRINIDGNILYPGPESSGIGFLTVIGFIVTLTTVGMFVTSHLILEEKKSRTLDVLLVSPATGLHVAFGKALAALFYCSIAIAIAFIVNATLVINWPLILLTTLLLALMMVTLGLVLGTFLETPQQLTLWGWVLLIPLLLPVFLSDMEPLIPSRVVAVIRWIPTVAISRVYRMALSDRVLFDLIWLPYTITLAITFGGLALVSRKIQQDNA